MLHEIKCFTNCVSLFETSGTSRQVNDRRLWVEVSKIWQMIQTDEISISWIEKTKRLSELLTKKKSWSYCLMETLRSGRLENWMHRQCSLVLLVYIKKIMKFYFDQMLFQTFQNFFQYFFLANKLMTINFLLRWRIASLMLINLH